MQKEYIHINARKLEIMASQEIKKEKMEYFLEDKKQTESDLWRKTEWLNQLRRNWLKRCKLFFPAEPWRDSKYRGQGAGHGANIR